MRRTLFFILPILALAGAGEAAACSMRPWGQPLGWSPERIREGARQLIARDGQVIVEAVVETPTLGLRGSGLVRVERVLRGSAPDRIPVQGHMCFRGFPDAGERGLIVMTPGQVPTSFIHFEYADAIRAELGAD